MKTYFTIVTLFLAFFIATDLGAQSWRFPDCRDLFITKVEVPISIEDKLYITVASQCDTCHQHVYTGLMVYSGMDTLAVEDGLYSKPSPDNNAVYRYALDIRNSFPFEESLRVEMVGGLCDSLSFATDWITSVQERLDQSSVIVFPNPSRGSFEVGMALDLQVTETRLYDPLGRLIHKWAYLPKELDISSSLRGVFWLHVDTEQGSISRKLLRF